ncbi:L-ribulose-5-phosphate 3-epimerase [Enterococcus dongliensis]|uniref:L-ribulose-5-phosphate 3-epimerase n=1 Tax=Enterococcus dongliensis TaxID=2559925 RepID=UPI00289C2AE0|nr:L-ribulose-5-phosphate 3-epimerase [Enterococcus dongliensis]
MAQIGIYEKALPKDISWKERFSLVKELGFEFIEMSIDETDERLARLDWTEKEIAELREDMFRTGIRINSICLSGHRRFPFGSVDLEKKKMAKEIMWKAIQLAHRLSIKVIQVAGYDVYYEEKSMNSRENFIEEMKASVKEASKYGVILSVEIMDDPFMNSISKFLEIKKQIHSPYLQVYPDLGNLSAWPENDPARELEKGIDCITSIHLKDTYPVTEESTGQFRDVPFGKGCVDFLGLLRTLKRLDYDGTFLIESLYTRNRSRNYKCDRHRNHRSHLVKSIRTDKNKKR